MFQFTKYSTFYYLFSGILVAAAIVSLLVFGLKFGIEFTGGTNMEVAFANDRPTSDDIANALSGLDVGDVSVQLVSDHGAILRFKGVDEPTHQKVLSALNNLGSVEEDSFQYIGPSVGDELRNRTIIAIVLALLLITAYIAFAFRKVSHPVPPWQYGVASLIALFHDIFIPLGIFSVLGKFYHVEITIPIVAALLTILGFSVHDTIVIFDRIRENIMRQGSASFAQTVDMSLNQTLGRSISTVVTVLLVLFALFFFGGQTLQHFSLALIIGITAGAYSSIFIASPLLVTWHRRHQKT